MSFIEFDPDDKIKQDAAAATAYLIFERSRAAMIRLLGAQEDYLERIVSALGISVEEFVENYDVEYKNIQTEYDTLANTVTLRFSQEFRVVPKEKK